MIAIDASETRENSHTDIPDAKVVTWLEEYTGADILITAYEEAPVVWGALEEHLANNALLVQVKHGGDLLASIGTRMNEALSRMMVAPHSWQRILLPVGHYAQCPKTGNVLVGHEKSGPEKIFINWWASQPPKDWRAYLTAMRRWNLRGGTVVHTCRTPADLTQWVGDAEVDLRAASVGNKMVWPETPRLHYVKDDDPLQTLHLVKDWRSMLAAAPGIGPKRVEALKLKLEEEGLSVTGAVAICWAAQPPNVRPHSFKVPGWGDKTRDNFRKFLGLEHEEESIVGFWQAEDISLKQFHKWMKEQGEQNG